MMVMPLKLRGKRHQTKGIKHLIDGHTYEIMGKKTLKGMVMSINVYFYHTSFDSGAIGMGPLGFPGARWSYDRCQCLVSCFWG